MVVRKHVEDMYPLSPMQRGMMFHCMQDPGSGVYLEQIRLSLDGLDAPTFRRAWERVFERHAALRTSVVGTGREEPVQVVYRSVELPWSEVDLRDRSEEEQRAALEEFLAADAARGFRLGEPPLVRLALLRTGERSYELVWTIHHIVLDGWSGALVLRDLFRCYRAFRSGDQPDLPRARKVRDYVAWVKQQDLSRAEAYWRERLAGFTAPTTLSIDRGAAAGGRGVGRYATEEVALSERHSRELAVAAARLQVTVNTLAQGAWALALGRYGGEEDVVFGAVVSGRPEALEGVDEMVGMFVNTLPQRVRIPGEASAREWLQGFQADQSELRDFSYSPLWQVQQWSQVAPGTPLFEHLFVFENVPSDPSTLAGDDELSVRGTLALDRTGYPLMLLVIPGERIVLRATYDAERFEGAAIRRLIGHYQRALAGLAEAGERPLSEVSLLDDDERRRVVVEWNDTRTDYPRERCVHELFAEQVALRPDATALVFGEQELSYAELDRRANQVAHHLAKRGVGPETMVAISAERSLETIVGIVGILKAGGAYVPLHPEYPRRRIELMLEDTQAPVLLTLEHLQPSLPDFAGHLVRLDADREEIAREPDTPPANGTTADDLAYVIYTSGSTGRPKGSCIEHRSVVRLVKDTDYLDLGPGEVFLQFAPLSFDASTLELWGSLLNGATLVVPPPGPLSLDELGRILVEHRVSTLWLTGALFRQMVDTQLEALRGVRQLLAGGEALSVPHVRRVIETLGEDARLINGYGPTENTTFTCCHVMTAISSVGRSVPIGRPIANTRVYVLDRNLEPVPVGVPGELCAAGDGLARGYLNDPELTAEKFVPDPFADEPGADQPGARMYRTGDLARWLPDGSLEFLGRTDEQVKVRGFRIEPGEIEATLAELPGVRDAVVVCKEDAAGDGRLIAYVVGEGDEASSNGRLQEILGERLPDYMVPSAFVFLDEIPVTSNGKVDRRALPEPTLERRGGEGRFVAPRSDLEDRIATIWSEVLGVEQVGARDNFFDLGGHSLKLLRVHARLKEELGCELRVTELFEYPTVEALARRLGDEGATEAELRVAAEARIGRRGDAGGNSIAIVGMAGRFPGAPDVETLWSNLRAGVESIRTFSDEELRKTGVPEPLLQDPNYVKARAVLDDVDLFDAWFFGYSPREAELIDPQQRIFLECASEALERAGCDPERFEGLIGVYAGVSANTYIENLRSRPELMAALGGMQAIMSSDRDYVATRVSYKLDLRGPSMNLQTACSTSLVAVHEACRSLLDHQCDVALAGGVSITIPLERGYLYSQEGIRSPDGHNRTFDARAEGTVSGQGSAAVVLKRLEDALAGGDEIHAVILGTALSNDGSDKVGFTAPSVEGQARTIAMAQAAAGVDPATISYVEAHGTATALGDPIEVAALTRVFRERTKERGFCALGSIKSNMGHLNDAAGVAGLIKTTLALRHRELPPSLHFEEPNPEIDFEASPFYVVAKREEWRAPDGLPRRAGVSSFGLGGTNAHAVLEEAPVRAPSAPGREWQVLPLSAKGPRALDAMAANLAGHLRRNPEENLADVAWTLQTGRRELEYRRAVWCRSAEDAVAVLEGGAPERVGSRRAPAKERPVVFLFPGHGHQHVDMGRGLYHAEPVFRDAVDEGLAVLESELDFDLRAAMFPDGDREAAAKRLLHRPLVFQPAIFLVDYAMDRLWRSWGVEPSACIGHSLGEFVAATSAGVLRMEDALRLVVLRGRLMEETPPGAMLALTLTADEVRERIADEPGVWLSTINAPELCLVAGAPESIEAFERRLTASGVECNRMHAAHAYHSGLMESGVEPLSEAVRGLTVEPPQVPYVSNVSGDWITEDEIREPAYWGRHMAATVRFAEGMERILEDPDRVLLEVGPGQIVSSLARLHESCGPDRVVVPSMRHPQGEEHDVEFLMGAVGRLWTGGVRPDWERFQASERRRVTLPTYPFEHKRYWIERRDTPGAGPGWAPARKADVGDWFHVSAWRRAAAPTLYDDVLPEPCLVFTDGSPFCARLVDRLGESGHPIVTVEAGEAFRRSDTGFAIDPGSPEDYGRLVRELEDAAGLPGRVLHLWNAGPVDGTPEDPERVQEQSFFSLFHLARAIGEAEVARPLWIQVVTEGVHDVTGDEVIQPEKATVLGPCRVLAFEFPNVTCRNVDLAADDVRTAEPEWLERVAHELLSEADEPVVTLRNGKRWVETFAPVRLDRPGGELPRRLRPGGAYLVTGGLTGIGSVLAQYLAQVPGAKLVLTGRTPLPERAEWERILEEHPAEDAVARRIRVVRTLEEAGAEVLAVEADVADLERMRAVVAEATRRFGAIRGVVHAAGVQAGGPIVLQEPGRAAQSLRPKVGGARVLRRLFEDGGLDFLVLCSSLNSVKGFPGVVDYSAANAYLDAFARRYAADTGTYAVSLAWNRWREVGMAAEAHGGALAEGRGISNAEGVEVLRRVLDGCDEPRLLVSEFDFWTMLSSVDRATEAEEGLDGASADEESSAQAAHSRPDLATAYVAPRTELERELVQVWEYLFGIDGIGVEDSFFDLGGHSLLATRLLNKLNRTHPGANLTLRGIFKSPSVALLAEKIEAAGDGRELGEVTIPAPEEPILATTDDLPDLDALSDEEVTALVAQMMEESELDERR